MLGNNKNKYLKTRDELKKFQQFIANLCNILNKRYMEIKCLEVYDDTLDSYSTNEYNNMYASLLPSCELLEKENKKLKNQGNRILELCGNSENLIYLVKMSSLNNGVFEFVTGKTIIKNGISENELANVEQLHYLILKLHCLSKERLQICIDAINEKFSTEEKSI